MTKKDLFDGLNYIDDQIIEEEQEIEETDEFDDSILKDENKTNLELTDEEETESYLEDEDISIDE